MSLIISPSQCQMSSTSRQTSPIPPAHGSPRLIHPPQQKGRGSDSSSISSPKTSPRVHMTPNFARATKPRSPSKKPEELNDPFLAQYIKPTSSLNHEHYFKSLNKQAHIKGFEYYQKYLNTNKGSSPRVTFLKQDAAAQKVSSPLRHQISPKCHPDSRADLDVGAQPRSQRRRKGVNEPVAQPEPKKSQPQVVAEILPLKFEDCAASDVINLMSRMIHSLISLNDRSVPASISAPATANASGLPEQKNKLLTRYHSRTPPAISIHTYITRLTKFNNLTPATLLTTIYYIDLLSHNFQPYFTLNSWTVHRFLLVATTLAQKSLEDFFFTNDHYARVGGVALTELNFLELDFLNRVNWKVVPAKQISETQTSIRHSKEVLDLYYWQLVNLMGKNTTEKDKITYLLPKQQRS